MAQFSLYVHKGGLKPDSFHFTKYRRLRIGRDGHLDQSEACDIS